MLLYNYGPYVFIDFAWCGSLSPPLSCHKPVLNSLHQLLDHYSAVVCFCQSLILYSVMSSLTIHFFCC